MKARQRFALRSRAVDCDALARGEQIFLLRPQTARERFELEHEEFWLAPVWDEPPRRLLTEPYRDRSRALDELRHRDGRRRLKYYATVEYLEPIAEAERLLPLDGDHTLSFTGVCELLERSSDGRLALLVLRVFERSSPVLLPDGGRDEGGRPGPWLRLPEEIAVGELEPVVADGAFVKEKARLLQRTGSVRAV